MSPVTLQLPPGAKVYNALYANTNPEDLTQDLLAVALPTGFFVDVGWFPEHDPLGTYCIRVFWQEWSAQQIPTIKTKNLNEVVQIVERLAKRFNGSAVLTSSSSSSFSPSSSLEVSSRRSTTDSCLGGNAISPLELTSSSSSSSCLKEYTCEFKGAA
jgi:hypothetical protein